MLYLTLALAGALVTRPGFAATVIKTGGTGLAVQAITDLGAAFKHTRPETDIVVFPQMRSGGAVQALGAGAIDLGLTARPLKPDERNPSLLELEVARTPLADHGY